MFIFNRAKDNKGAVLIYILIVVCVAMILFSGMFASLNSTSAMTVDRLNKQQLQLDAQSVLNVLTTKFKSTVDDENGVSNVDRLRDYAQRARNTGVPTKATFKLEGEDNVIFTAYVDYYSEKYAKLTIEALDLITNKSAQSFDIIKFGEAERNSVFDNMFVVYHPDLSNGILNADRIKSKVLAGNMIVDHKSTQALTYSRINEIKDMLTNVPQDEMPRYEGKDLTIKSISTDLPTKISSVVSNGIINISGDGNANNQLVGVENAMIASPVGRVNVSDITLKGDFKLVGAAGKDANDPASPAAGGGVLMKNTKIDTADNDLMVLTRDNGYIQFEGVSGIIGNVRSGGDFTVKGATDLNINEDIVVYKSTDVQTGKLNIGGSLFGNQRINAAGGELAIGGDLFGTDDIIIKNKMSARGVYGGKSVTLGSNVLLFGNGDIPTVLSGGDYKNENRGTMKIDSANISGKMVYNYTGSATTKNNANLQRLNNTTAYWDAFSKANNYWRDGIARCTKGGFTTGSSPKINVVVALTKDSDTASLTTNEEYIFDESTSIKTNLLYATNKVKTLRSAVGDKYATIDGNNWYIKGVDGNREINVSGDLTFANDDSKLMLRTEVCDWIGGPVDSYNTQSFSEGAIMTLYNDAISKYGIPPTVTDRVSQPSSGAYATIQKVSDTEYQVLYGGRMELAGDYGSNQTVKANFVGKGIGECEISNDAKFVFNNISTSYLIYLTNIQGKNENNWIYFPWDIEVKYKPVPYSTAGTEDYVDEAGITWKAAGEENSVAFFVGKENKVWFTNGRVIGDAVGDTHCKLEYVVKKNSDNSCEYAVREYESMPEVYFLSPRESYSQNGNQNQDPVFRFDNYFFKGFLVAPRSYVDFERMYCGNGTEIFRGTVMAKDIVLDAGNTGTNYNYYFPLSYNRVLNGDNFTMYLDKNGSQ